ncbi:hypothetical protein SLS60_002893 [Paraconiothyrium brasiliense]|uniref:Uncharacterized protein n=1 Tax=Paraconiothyrium brasiliense TaxID=300254 RepID=A0ABR3RU39_9PLEO
MNIILLNPNSKYRLRQLDALVILATTVSQTKTALHLPQPITLLTHFLATPQTAVGPAQTPTAHPLPPPHPAPQPAHNPAGPPLGVHLATTNARPRKKTTTHLVVVAIEKKTTSPTTAMIGVIPIVVNVMFPGNVMMVGKGGR